MTDTFLLLTPILMFFVVALLAFVGCDRVYGVYPFAETVTGLTGTAGDATVLLSWNSAEDASGYKVMRSTTQGGPYAQYADVTVTNYVDNDVTNGTTYYYVIDSHTDDTTSPASNEVALTPMSPIQPPPTPTPFLTGETQGTALQNFEGFLGMAIQVGPNPVTVGSLGRWVIFGNTHMHIVKIVDAATNTDVPGGSVVVDTSGATAGAFAYVDCPVPVILNANKSYFIVSQETNMGDFWYNDDTTVQTTDVASVTGSIFQSGTTYMQHQGATHSYIPVDFRY